VSVTVDGLCSDKSTAVLNSFICDHLPACDLYADEPAQSSPSDEDDT